ncbi:hypothetical protein [Flavobacterium sp.]|uniref:hypothetical protein n=1 Tax=Flavobacterium sp. TaxID=239 RepID=UPI002637B57F|nr:hypothetical protein [Flavobacterium sp.]
MNELFNVLVSLVFLLSGLYFIYSTYKKPAVLFSTDLKGYIAGIGLIAIGIMSLFGKMKLIEVVQDIFNAGFKS